MKDWPDAFSPHELESRKNEWELAGCVVQHREAIAGGGWSQIHIFPDPKEWRAVTYASECGTGRWVRVVPITEYGEPPDVDR